MVKIEDLKPGDKVKCIYTESSLTNLTRAGIMSPPLVCQNEEAIILDPVEQETYRGGKGIHLVWLFNGTETKWGFSPEFFELINSQEEKEDSHEGQVYNPITESWSWL
jgi:hypothetical protein